MTSSQSVIQPRRAPIRPGALILAFAIAVCAAIPVWLWQSGLFGTLEVDKLFSKPKPTSSSSVPVSKAVIPPAEPETRSVKSPPVSDSVAWVNALDNASKDLSAQIERSPRDPSLQNRQGLIYLSLGDLAGSEQCFSNAVNLCRSGLSDCATRMERQRSAGNMQDASRELLVASQLTVELSAAHSHLARIFEQKGDRQRVLAELEQLNRDSSFFSGFALGGGRLQTTDGRLSPLEAQSLARAETLLRSDQVGEAVAEFKRLATMNPKLAIPHERIGIISAMANDLPTAVQEWEIAAHIDPGSASVQNNLGLAYQQLDRSDDARQAFQRAVDLDPASEEASLNLSNLLSTDGDVDGAMRVLTVATEKVPGSARAHNNLGSLQSLAGNYQEAISSYHKALSIDPDMASAHYGMGVALLKTHCYLPAIKQLKQALALNPKMQEAQTRIEEAYRLAGRNGRS